MDEGLVFEALRRGLITPEMAKAKLSGDQFESGVKEQVQQERSDALPALVRSGIGLGAGLVKTGVGVIQAGADLVGAEDWSQAAGKVVDKIDADVKRLRGAGKIGAFVGEVGPYMAAPGGGATLAGRMLTGAGSGALAGALKPVGSKEDYNRGMGAVVGAGVGAAVPLAFEGVRKGVGNTYRALVKPDAKIKDLMDAGLPVSVGQSAGGGLAAGERTLSQLPVSGQPLRNFGERQTQALSKGLGDVGNAISQEGTERGSKMVASATGGTVRRGLQDALDTINSKTEGLYDKVYNQVKPNVAVDTAPALAVIEKAKQAFPDNPEAAAKAGLGKVTEWEEVLKKPLRFADLKSLKQSIWATAEKAENAEVKPLLRELYKGVDDSLKLTASQIVKGADADLKRADKFYQASRDLVDRVGGMLKTPQDEKLLADFLKLSADPTKGGADIKLLRQLNQRMPIKAMREIAAYKLASMGLSSAGQEGVERTLSPRTFVTQWKNMSTEAKDLLFSRQLNPGQIRALNRLVDYADLISKRPLNTSGTAATLAEVGAASGLVGAAAAGYNPDNMPQTLAWALAPVLLSKGATSQTLARAINKLPPNLWTQPPQKVSNALSGLMGQFGLGQ